MSFLPGDIVVFIANRTFYREKQLTTWAKYIVREFVPKHDGMLTDGVKLVGIVNGPFPNGEEASYRAEDFRKFEPPLPDPFTINANVGHDADMKIKRRIEKIAEYLGGNHG